MAFSTPDKIKLMMHDSVYVCFFSQNMSVESLNYSSEYPHFGTFR